MLPLGVVTRISVTVLIMPLLAFVLRLFLFKQDRPVLSDTEIAAFVFTPIGLIALLIVGGFSIGVALVEQAGLMTIGFAAVVGRRLNWFASLVLFGSRPHRAAGCCDGCRSRFEGRQLVSRTSGSAVPKSSTS